METLNLQFERLNPNDPDEPIDVRYPWGPHNAATLLFIGEWFMTRLVVENGH